MGTRSLVCTAIVAALGIPAAEAWDLEARISISAADDEAVAGVSLAQGTIVYFEPEGGAASQPTSVDVVMQRKQFVPRVVAAPIGSSIRFPNRDPILHNVFSVSDPNGFDLGLYREGDGEAVALTHPGVVRVFCNVHQAMAAYVLMLETPFFTRPEPDGTFLLRGLPDGGGTLHVWNERSSPWQATVSPGETVSVELALDRERVPRHTNKFGKPYSRARRRDY